MTYSLELFSGSGGFKSTAEAMGLKCFSLDSRNRANVCTPDFHMNILDFNPGLLPHGQIDLLWIGLPCDIWSYASGSSHLDKGFNPVSSKALLHFEILWKTLSLISELKPKFWFIENPRARLGRFLILNKHIVPGPFDIISTSLDQFSFPTIKPTSIITNSPHLYLPPISRYGRGNKNKLPGAFDNMTKCQRQKTPVALYHFIISQHLEFI
jgi:hypothetical protein